MNRTTARRLAAAMLASGVCFFLYAVTHPTASFPWGNGVTYTIYLVYLVLMIFLFIAPFKK